LGFIFRFFFYNSIEAKGILYRRKWLWNTPGSHHLFMSQLILALLHNIQSLPSQSFAKSGDFFGVSSDEQQMIIMTPVKPESQSFLIGRLTDGFSFLHPEMWP